MTMYHAPSSPQSLAYNIKPDIKWKQLFLGLVYIALLVICGRLSLFLAALPKPAKYASIAVLLVMAFWIYLASRALVRWAKTLTFKRVITVLIVVYVLAVIIAGLIMPGPDTFGKSLLHATYRVPAVAGVWIYRSSYTAVSFPIDFRRTYLRSILPIRIRVSDVDGNSTPVLVNSETQHTVIVLPETTNADAQMERQGSDVLVNVTGAAQCEMYALVEESFEVGDRVKVMEGPRYIGQELWWRVRNDTKIGWCPGIGLDS